MPSRDAETAQKDEAFWKRPLALDFKGFFQTLGKATLHTSLGKWDDVAADAIDLMATADIKRTPPQLAGLLLRQSMQRAAFDLLRGRHSPAERRPVTRPAVPGGWWTSLRRAPRTSNHWGLAGSSTASHP